jgi:hypothetical protein
MASTFATTAWLSLSSAVVTGFPASIACWTIASTTALTNDLTLIQIGDSTFGNYFNINADNAATYAEIHNSGGYFDASSSTLLSTSVWTHVCAVFNSASPYASIYVNGTKGTDYTTSKTVSAFTQSLIAAYGNVSGDGYVGSLAQVGIWNTNLVSSDVTALNAGFSPKLVRAANLVSYVPLLTVTGTEPDRCRATGWTVNGTPVSIANPRIFGF